jgi:ferric-dicitrate binding protein FerR (iron transport regulator)
MTRPSTRAVRRAAGELSEQVTPHLSTAKGALIEEVLPKVKATGAELLPKAKAAGAGVAVTATRLAPKKRRPLRMAAIAGALALGAYAAWNAWRLPHGSDDWTHADSTAAGTESPAAEDAPAVPVGTGPIAG